MSANPMSGNPYIIHKLAQGLFAEYMSETFQNRLNMIRQVYRLDGGPERLAGMKFLRMVDEARKRGDV